LTDAEEATSSDLRGLWIGVQERSGASYRVCGKICWTNHRNDHRSKRVRNLAAREGHHLKPADGVFTEYMKELGIHPADPDINRFRWLLKFWG
jgi:hypothetical protein